MKILTQLVILICVLIQFLSCDILRKPATQEHVSEQTTWHSQALVLSDIIRIFRESNPMIDNIAIVDICQKYMGADEYIVLAWGIRGDRIFEGSLSDELFGLFIIDRSFTRVVTVLDIVPTKRWNDYTMRIEKPIVDNIILVGEGTTYGDNKFCKEYILPEE